MGPKKHKIGMQHIQINKRLQFETLAQSRGSESLASLAWRNISGIADRARWRSGVVFVTFPCLFPLHIVTTALGRCSPWWCPRTHTLSAALMRPCDKVSVLTRRGSPVEMEGVMSEIAQGSQYHFLMSSSPPGDASHR